jgi:hypothetical protein
VNVPRAQVPAQPDRSPDDTSGHSHIALDIDLRPFDLVGGQAPPLNPETACDRACDLNLPFELHVAGL